VHEIGELRYNSRGCELYPGPGVIRIPSYSGCLRKSRQEKRIIELKQEINALCAELGRPPAHNLDFLDEDKPQRRPGD
jgi:hypothetical protein